MPREALSLDLDGPTIWRIVPTQRKASAEYRKYGVSIYSAPPFIPKIPRVVSDAPLRPGEILNLFFHQIRFVFPNAAHALLELLEVDVFGNTGRSNKRPWVEATAKTLKKGGVWGRLETVFHKPSGLLPMISKIAGVTELREAYDRVSHIDDNPADALPIAAKYRDVRVVLIKDLDTDHLLSGVNLKRDFPNTNVVRTLREALQILYPKYRQLE